MDLDWKKLLSEVRIRDFYISPDTPSSSDHRSEFERDYDRSIFSTPVRRLLDKAQVFPLEANDSVRTRLTHSLEVSTVARDMARAIGGWLEKEGKIEEKEEKAIETIAATCGLIHDLGNPPFGHAGEMAIREWFDNQKSEFWEITGGMFKQRLKNDFLEFEGNAQTIRLISKLQLLSDMYGLNLTCGTMSAAFKYIAHSGEINKGIHAFSKVGYFTSEESLLELVQHETGTKGARNPITYIVEAADDIVYSVVDIEDGLRKGVIGWDELKEKLKEECEQTPHKKKMLEDCFEAAENMIDKKKGSIPLKGRAREEAYVQAFRVHAIAKSVKATIAAFTDKYEDIMAGSYQGELYKDSEAYLLIQACKKVGKKYIYRSEQNLKLELMGRKVIHGLMDIFWEGAEKGNGDGGSFANKTFSLFSKNYVEAFKGAQNTIKPLGKYKNLFCGNKLKSLPQKYLCMQLLTDYICGMTDTFACDLYKQLTNG